MSTRLYRSRLLIVVVALGWVGSVCGEESDADAERCIRKHLRPWDRYDNSWNTESEIVVLAQYREGSYPCIFYPDGSSDMPISSTFTIEQTLKGKLGRVDFDANLAEGRGKRLPKDFVSGRKYLVFLKPTEASKRLLNDKKAIFNLRTQLSTKELIAIVDVSKSKVEVESAKVTAHKTGKLGAFVFTPEKWQQLRQSKKIDLAAQRAFLPFLMQTVLPDKATIAHVRAYLGRPDRHHMNEDGTYYEYQLNTGAPTPHGTVSGRVELHFTPDTRLKGYYIKFYKHIEESSGEGKVTNRYLRELNAEEQKALGLKTIDRYDP